METKPRRKLIRLVACSTSKLNHAAPARELYTGDLTRKAIGYAERRGATMILSAKYGLVGLDEVIRPYDQRLDKMTAKQLEAWARRVRRQLSGQGALGGVLLVHAGGTYVVVLRKALAGTGTVVTSTFRKPTGLGDRKGFYARDARALSGRIC